MCAEPRVDHFEGDLADPDAPAAGTLEELTAAELDGFLAVDLRATLLLVKELALQHDGRPGGHVVLLTSGEHLAAMPREVAYAVSKGALHQATATLSGAPDPARDLRECRQPRADRHRLGHRRPCGRHAARTLGTPEDAARLVGWLCTDDAAWITGQVIDSEGGFVRYRAQ